MMGGWEVGVVTKRQQEASLQGCPVQGTDSSSEYRKLNMGFSSME